MARRAKFGRRPNVQPNIQGTLIAVAREAMFRTDSNMMDAWKSGGEVDGMPVTDDRALNYWKGRLADLDKKDPAYDTIKTQIMQLQYAVEQSKMDLKYVQGKIDEREYAQFFIKWSKKVPKNGEFWRALQKDAAQLMERAKEKARIEGEKAKQESFNRFVAGHQSTIDLGNALTDAINQLSKETGLSITGNGDLLLDMLSEDYRENPGKYHRLEDTLPSGFSGTFTTTWVGNQIADAESSYDVIADRAKRDGYTEAYNSATSGQANMSAWTANMEVWPVSKAYDKALQAFAKTWDDPAVSDRDKDAAAAAFAKVVTNLAKTPGIDNATQMMLEADALRLMGQDAGDAPSFGQQLGKQGVTVEVSAQIANHKVLKEAMDALPGQYVYAPRNPDGTYDHTGKGPIGIVPAGAVPSDAVMVAIPGLTGAPSMVKMPVKQITAKDPLNPNADPVNVGSFVQYNVGGRTLTLYQYKDQNGQAAWTATNPFERNVSQALDSAGNLVLTPMSVNPMARAAELDAQYPGMNIAAQLQGKTLGSEKFEIESRSTSGDKLTVKWSGTDFTVVLSDVQKDAAGKTIGSVEQTIPWLTNNPADIQKNVLSASRWQGSSVGTFSTPLGASVAQSTVTMSGSQVASLAQDEAFQHAFVYQTMQAYGTSNPLDPRVMAEWQDTTRKAAVQFRLGTEATGARAAWAAERDDLDYPGIKKDPTTTTMTIGFAGRDLKLPGVPAYLKGAGGSAPAIDLNGVSDILGWAAGKIGVSIPALRAGALPAEMPKPTSMGGFNPAPVPAAKPAVSTKSSPAPSVSMGGFNPAPAPATVSVGAAPAAPKINKDLSPEAPSYQTWGGGR